MPALRVQIAQVLALSCLFFVVTGVQFWATSFLEEYADKKLVNPVFVAVAGTGPTAGVIAGGAIYDKRGGYSTPAGRYACLKVCCSFSALAVAWSIVATLAADFYNIVFAIWMLLFFGGAILPGASGTVMAAVRKDLRAFSSALSMTVYCYVFSNFYSNFWLIVGKL